MTITESPLPNTGRLRALIADDVQETRRAIRLMLSLEPDLEVAAIAHDGREAVELAQKHHPDLAFIDVNMPEMDGVTAIGHMMEDNPDLVCIVISAERDSETLRAAMAAGARAYLIKPFTGDELAAVVERAVRQAQANRDRAQKEAETHRQREVFLKQLAEEYSRSRRTDNQAVQVYEALAENPHCEPRWLMTLAMVYVIRRQWTKLKNLAARMEQQGGLKPLSTD